MERDEHKSSDLVYREACLPAHRCTRTCAADRTPAGLSCVGTFLAERLCQGALCWHLGQGSAYNYLMKAARGALRAGEDRSEGLRPECVAS